MPSINLAVKIMKNTVAKLVLTSTLGSALSLVASLNAQTVTFDPTTYTDGSTYMSWSAAPSDAAGYGGSGAGGWSLAALPATISGETLTLAPNSNVYAAGNDYWANADGSGANIMDGAVFTTAVGEYVNTSLTFTFDVTANTLAAGYTADAFIKDFGPGYSYNGEETVNLTPGVDSVTYPLTGNNAGEIVQFGFEVVGPDANPSAVPSLGSVSIEPAAAPEPSTLALAGLGGSALLGLIRRRK
jgi:hypothetical protein